MNPYNVTGPTAAEVAQVESIVSQRLKGSFLWMVVGLLTTIGVGFAALVNPNWLRFAYQKINRSEQRRVCKESTSAITTRWSHNK